MPSKPNKLFLLNLAHHTLYSEAVIAEAKELESIASSFSEVPFEELCVSILKGAILYDTGAISIATWNDSRRAFCQNSIGRRGGVVNFLRHVFCYLLGEKDCDEFIAGLYWNIWIEMTQRSWGRRTRPHFECPLLHIITLGIRDIETQETQLAYEYLCSIHHGLSVARAGTLISKATEWDIRLAREVAMLYQVSQYGLEALNKYPRIEGSYAGHLIKALGKRGQLTSSICSTSEQNSRVFFVAHDIVL